jgi:hypothetical protein
MQKKDEAGMRIKAVTVGVVLAGTALGSAALNLGRARGAAWIGQPLDLMVPVQTDPGQADGALCAEAEVFHGDSKQESSRVQVQTTPTDQPDSFNLKISSSALVDEPVVTVYLRAGCAQKVSRKYVLLADFPSEAAAPLSRSVAPTAPQLPLVVPGDTAQGSPSSALPSTGNTKASAPSKDGQKTVKAILPAMKEKPKTVVADVGKEPKPKSENPAKTEKPAGLAKPADAGKPRLRLDPVETLSERVKSLETTTTQAAPNDDAARDSQRMQALQSDMKALLDQAVKNEASLAAMRERLEKAESDRVPVAAVYGLGALVLLCMGALALMWSKRPKNVVWNSLDTPEDALAASKVQTTAKVQTSSPEKDFDVNTEDVDKASFDALVADQTSKQKAATTEPSPDKRSATGLPRSNFNADYLVDLRQQAEFLAKLGKVDEALEVLEGGIRSNPKESPLLFMDLLGIANNFNRKTDFRQFRELFVQLFNVSVPEVALSSEEGRSLDAYPALLEHINSQWESPHVLDVIEACILRDPDARESDPFDLAAFRELVNMHGVATEHHGQAQG